MKQLLFIKYRESECIDTGGEQVTKTNFRVLGQIFGEENITIYPIHRKQSKIKILSQAFSILLIIFKGYYYGLTAKKIKEITTLGMEYPYVFIDRSVFGIIAKVLKEKGYKGKIITFFHNVEPVYFEARIGRNVPWCSIVVNCVGHNEKQACDYSDVIIALNKRDGQEIQQRYHRTPDIISPVVFEDNYEQDNYPEEDTDNCPVCLFIGTYFPINVRGILWFVDEVLPHTNIRLQIVGKGMKAIKPKVKKYKNIEVYSDVPDLKPYIENADFILSPIFEGSGMKVKTCEALMYGKNIIGTTEAFEGYDINFEKVGALCNTKQEFITTLNAFSFRILPKFNKYSREIFMKNHLEESKLMKFNKILTSQSADR